MVTYEGMSFLMNNKAFKNIGNQTNSDPTYSYEEIKEISERDEHTIIYHLTKNKENESSKMFCHD